MSYGSVVSSIPGGVPAEVISSATEAVAHLVSLEEGSLTAALEPLERLLESTTVEIALLVMAQLCAGVTLGCADFLDVDPVQLVRDTAAAVLGSGTI